MKTEIFFVAGLDRANQLETAGENRVSTQRGGRHHLLNRQGLTARFSRSKLADHREQNRIERVGILNLRNVPDILYYPKRC